MVSLCQCDRGRKITWGAQLCRAVPSCNLICSVHLCSLTVYLSWVVLFYSNCGKRDMMHCLFLFTYYFPLILVKFSLLFLLSFSLSISFLSSTTFSLTWCFSVRYDTVTCLFVSLLINSPILAVFSLFYSFSHALFILSPISFLYSKTSFHSAFHTILKVLWSWHWDKQACIIGLSRVCLMTSCSFLHSLMLLWPRMLVSGRLRLYGPPGWNLERGPLSEGVGGERSKPLTGASELGAPYTVGL